MLRYLKLKLTIKLCHEIMKLYCLTLFKEQHFLLNISNLQRNPFLVSST